MREIPQIDWINSNRELSDDLNEFYQAVKDNVNDLQENAFKKDRDNFSRNAVCLQSPNGNWHKITVADNGTLSTSQVTPELTTNPYVT